MLSTQVWKDKFFEQQYGYFEIVCKVPEGGKTFWPAFWLWGNGWPPEIDVFEFMATEELDKKESKYITMTSHFGTPGKLHMTKSTMKGRRLRGVDFSKEFHTFAVKWEWNYIEWYIDHIPVYRIIDNIPTNKMHIVVNTASKFGHIPSDDVLPGTLIVKRITAYEEI